MPDFEIVSDFVATGDQPRAIDQLTDGLEIGLTHQTLLGVTGSGKTFTMACVVERVQRPTLVIAHNKTLAAQLATDTNELSPASVLLVDDKGLRRSPLQEDVCSRPRRAT